MNKKKIIEVYDTLLKGSVISKEIMDKFKEAVFSPEPDILSIAQAYDILETLYSADDPILYKTVETTPRNIFNGSCDACDSAEEIKITYYSKDGRGHDGSLVDMFCDRLSDYGLAVTRRYVRKQKKTQE